MVTSILHNWFFPRNGTCICKSPIIINSISKIKTSTIHNNRKCFSTCDILQWAKYYSSRTINTGCSNNPIISEYFNRTTCPRVWTEYTNIRKYILATIITNAWYILDFSALFCDTECESRDFLAIDSAVKTKISTIWLRIDYSCTGQILSPVTIIGTISHRYRTKIEREKDGCVANEILIHTYGG